MKVLFFTKYSRKGASSRLRTFQYLDFFRSNGIECHVNDFFSDAYLEELYRTKKHNKFLALKSFLSRLIALVKIFRYDRVVIEKELFPYLPSFPEKLLSVLGIKYIVDYDDAIFHNYDISTNGIIRFFLKDKIRNVIKHAGLVVVGNDYLKDKAIEFGARRVILVPTVIDTDKYSAGDEWRNKTVTIGWIGSPITFKYVRPFKDLFQKLASIYEIKLKFIGASTGLDMPEIEEIIPWSEDSEVDVIKTFDIGIMPLEDNIWERGKCGYKLIQYMGCGVPVIGTPIGVNDILITNYHNGFKAVSLEDWEKSLKWLIEAGPDGRKEMGRRGRTIVEEHYSLQVYRHKWLSILTGSI
jgi:glycosyltransferase involved in cell wall biosynthesis